AIFEELEGTSFHDIVSEGFDLAREEMTKEFKQTMGIDLDLSNITATDDEEAIKRKLAEALDAARTSFETNPPKKPKSKKEQLKEQKAKELEQLQKTGLNSIYKQLVKAFHPDLEQDPNSKGQKEDLMKKLIIAYEKNDLFTLLALQSEWLNQ